MNRIVRWRHLAFNRLFVPFFKRTFVIGRVGLATIYTGLSRYILSLCPAVLEWNDWKVRLNQCVATMLFRSMRAE